MGYDLHIERDEPITANEWRAAVAAAPALLRLSSGNPTATNPETGQVISMARTSLDAEVWFDADQTWQPVFHVFDDPGDDEEGDEPGLRISVSGRLYKRASVLAALRHLVHALAADVVGDEGEPYDLDDVAGSP